MENTPEHPLFREDRKAQTLVKRIEKKQAYQAVAREAETKGTLEEYGNTVGSYNAAVFEVKKEIPLKEVSH